MQSAPEVALLRCRRCNAYSASRMPTESALSDYYSGYFTDFNSLPKVTHDSPERFARHIASFLGRPPSHLVIADFGGGDGTLAYSLARILCRRGTSCADITVIDFAEPRVSDDKGIAIKSVRPNSGVPQSDIILASAVLEHIPDLISCLKRLFGALKVGGTLYIRTPAVAGFMQIARIFGVKLDFTFPAHVHDLGQEFWENVLKIVPEGDAFEILHSAPSLVETDFRTHPWHTLAAYLAKAPWRILGRRYTLVGGWEIVFRRKKESAAEAAD